MTGNRFSVQTVPTFSPSTAIPTTTSAPTPWVLNPKFDTIAIVVAKNIPLTGATGRIAVGGISLIDDGSIAAKLATSNPTNLYMKNGSDLSGTTKVDDVSVESSYIFKEVRFWNCPPVQLHTLPTGTALTGPFSGGFYCGKDMRIPDNSIVILDGNNIPTSKWIFSLSITGTNNVGLITGRRSAVILTNLGDPNLVFWVVQRVFVAGAYSQLVGNIIGGSSTQLSTGYLMAGRSLNPFNNNLNGFTRHIPVNYVLKDQSVALGTCPAFAIHSKGSVTFQSVLNYVDVGSVGVSPGTSVSGSYIINFGTTQTGISSPAVTTCASDSSIGITTGVTTRCTTILGSPVLPSIMRAGVYCSDAGPLSIAAWSTVVLDGANVSTSVWYFQSSTTITANFHATVVLKFGALAKNVYWFAETAVTLGISSALVGNVYSGTTMTFNSYSRLEGRALAQGAVTLNGFNYVSTLYNYPNFQDVGDCFYFAVEGGPSIFFYGMGSIIGGWMGITPGTSISGPGTYKFKSEGSNTYLNTLPAQNCMISLKAAINRAGATICQNDIVTGDLSNLVLNAGVYCSSSGSLFMNNLRTLTLNARGDSSATWLFQASGTITTGSGTSIILLNNARSENTFWVAGGTTTVGASSFFRGTILSFGAVTFADLTRLDGRALSVGSVYFLGATIVTLPPNTVPTGQPSSQPSTQPTGKPSGQPTTQPTMQPSGQPTSQPTTQPTCQPTSRPSAQPTGQPTRQPTHPTGQPTSQPSMQPSGQPSSAPTQPTGQPTSQPSCQPTGKPTGQPTRQPTSQPTGQPTRQPSSQPSSQPTGQPSRQPSSQPTNQPSSQPSGQPTGQPTMQPSSQPTGQPTSQPTCQPSGQPTGQPSGQPSSQPTNQPSSQPSGQPTGQPVGVPSSQPTGQPTSQPTDQPISQPTMQPTGQPSGQPTGQPTMQPSSQPTGQPISQPTSQPSSQPTMQPTCQPSGQPTGQPSGQPSSQPTDQPSGQPTGQPVAVPSSQPTGQPTSQPTVA